MRILVTGLGGRHELTVEATVTVRGVKELLEASADLEPAQMKILVKGKCPGDDATLADLGLIDGAKLMLMRSQLGTTKQIGQAGSSSSPDQTASWLHAGAKVLYRSAEGALEHAHVRAVHTDDPSAPYYTIEVDGAERQTSAERLLRRDDGSVADVETVPPAEAGTGSVALTVVQGRRQLRLRCEPTSSIGELKRSLISLVDGGSAASMRLLVKGKEAHDGSTVEALGLAAGGKLMLLFRAGHHRSVESAAVVRDCAVHLANLRERVTSTRHKITKRLLCGAEALGELGALSDEVAKLTQDVQNAVPNEAAEAATVRKEQLAQLEELASALAESRRLEAQAELRGQIGR